MKPGVYRNVRAFVDLECRATGLIAMQKEDDMGYAYATHSCNSGCDEPHIDEHVDDCECDLCHDNHASEYGMHITDGVCSRCTDEIDRQIIAGLWCLPHRRMFIDCANTICNICEEEQYVENLVYKSAEQRIISFDGAADLLFEYFSEQAAKRAATK